MNSVSEQYSTHFLDRNNSKATNDHPTVAYTLVPNVDAVVGDDGELHWEQQGGTEGASTMRGMVEQIMSSNTFQTAIAGVIVANAIVIGLETDCPENMQEWQFLENAFLVIFTIELLLRMWVFGSTFWTSKTEFGWNMFDLVVVFFGLLDAYLSKPPPEVKDSGDEGNHHHHHHRGKFSILRVFRLLRILRIFRLFRMLKQLYILASGFVEATSAIFWVSLLTALWMYICAIMLTKLLGQPARAALRAETRGNGEDADNGYERETNLFLREHFGDIKASMFTLFELMAHPNIEEYQVVIQKDPYMKVFFILFVIVCSFAMLSLLTGVISETMIEKSQMRKEEMKFIQEQKRTLFCEQLRGLFHEADIDRSGCLSKDEFRTCLSKILHILEEEGVAMTEEELASVFDMIDFDGSGSIDIDEFLLGMTHLNKPELRAIDIMEIQYSIRRVQGDMLEKLDGTHNFLSGRLSTVEHRLEQMVNALQKA